MSNVMKCSHAEDHAVMIISKGRAGTATYQLCDDCAPRIWDRMPPRMRETATVKGIK